MASKKMSQTVNLLPCASKTRWKQNGMQILMMMMMTMMAAITPTESFLFKSLPRKNVIITNNHTKILSVRCFNFYDEVKRVHLKPNQSYQFTVQPYRFYPSSTMYNCSTNMGVFTAYRYNYRCSFDDQGTPCEWMFDQDRAYRKDADWIAIDYLPNYESLGRGGIIKGYFTN